MSRLFDAAWYLNMTVHLLFVCPSGFAKLRLAQLNG